MPLKHRGEAFCTGGGGVPLKSRPSCRNLTLQDRMVERKVGRARKAKLRLLLFRLATRKLIDTAAQRRQQFWGRGVCILGRRPSGFYESSKARKGRKGESAHLKSHTEFYASRSIESSLKRRKGKDGRFFMVLKRRRVLAAGLQGNPHQS